MVDFSDRTKPPDRLAAEFIAGVEKVVGDVEQTGTTDRALLDRLMKQDEELWRRTQEQWARRAENPQLALTESLAETYRNAAHYGAKFGVPYAVYLRPESDPHFSTHPFVCGERSRAERYAEEYGYKLIDTVAPQDNK